MVASKFGLTIGSDEVCWDNGNNAKSEREIQQAEAGSGPYNDRSFDLKEKIRNFIIRYIIKVKTSKGMIFYGYNLD